jgi:hypothetical protein
MANRSQVRLAIVFVPLARNQVTPQRGRAPWFCVCSGKKTRNPCLRALLRWFRTWATQRPASQIFHSRHATSCHAYNGMSAICNPRDRHFPPLLQHIQARDHASNRRKPHCEQCKCRQQFPYKVQLQCNHNRQEPPHPFPTVVLVFHPNPWSLPLQLQTLPSQLRCLGCAASVVRSRSAAPVPFHTKSSPKSMVHKAHFYL